MIERAVGGVIVICLLMSAALAVDALAADGALDNRLTLHMGREHEGGQHMLHHGMGRGGKGVCPQMRTVPQAPEKFVDMKNPLARNEKNLNEGESLFQLQAEPTACKICHGMTGNGLGMMAQGSGAVPRNFACAETMQGISDGQLFWVIKNGSGGTGMPAYKFLKDDQIWQLILYLRRFAD